MSSRRLFAAVFVVLAGLLALHAYRYFPFLTEEALDSLHYARRLASGGGLTWTDGERVEGYTNFLWVVLNGGFDRLGLDVVTSARALGFAGVLLAIGCIGLEPRAPGVFLPRLVVGGVLIVATVPIAIWSIGALEQGLVVGLVALSLRLLERSARVTDARRLWISGVPLALVVLLRAEGFVLALAMLAAAACLPRPSGESLKRSAIVAIPSGVALFSQFAFRLVYYGDWLPSPARLIKHGRFGSGLDYVGAGYALASMLVLLALVATVLTYRRGERFRLLLPWAVVVVTTVTAVAGGGEPLPGHRDLLLALVALCFVVADEAGDDWARVVTQRVLVLPILALCAFLHVTQGTETADSRRAKDERTAFHALAIGRTLHSAFGARAPLLAVDAPGALAFSAELPSLDLTGVRSVAFESAEGVLRRAPELFVFGAGSGKADPTSTLGQELVRTRRFRDAYQWIGIEGSAKDSEGAEVWVRRERGKLGVSRSHERVDIPGYFFSGEASRSSSVLDHGKLVAELTARAPGEIVEFAVPPGRFRLESSPPGAVLDVRCRGVSMQGFAPAGEESVIEVDGKMPISIAVAPARAARTLRLRSVSLVRVSDAPNARRCAPAGRPLRVAAAAVAEPKKQKNFWTHPSHVVFVRDGLVVEFGELASVGGVEVSLSDNESYVLELRDGRRVVWTMRESGKRNKKRPALEAHRYELPQRLESGSYELSIKPSRGDSPALGYAVLF